MVSSKSPVRPLTHEAKPSCEHTILKKHQLLRVVPKQLCALAHPVCTYTAGTSKFLLFQKCEFFSFQNFFGTTGFKSEQIVSNQSTFESKNIHSFRTVHPRQIFLAEVKGNEGFIKLKVLSDYDFRDFWRN